MSRPTINGWQVWSYSWSNGNGPIPETVLFGGHVYRTKAEAESAWYDTCPGRNDHATYVRAKYTYTPHCVYCGFGATEVYRDAENMIPDVIDPICCEVTA